ncbi:MAG: hypothetical protein DSM106950_43800 [Stigonema ocellatum SAG 48.90 = DSM 106950]|nr:hypothetical protein [Stigonema ocellatum SAG 48.90 = DSM 106950]
MIPFTTSPEQKIRVYKIATRMADAGLSVAFINDAVEMAEEYEGLHDLMVFWDEETRADKIFEEAENINTIISEME